MRKKNGPPKPRKFPPAKQRRLDELLEKNSDGSLTPKERVALETLVAEAEEWMIANLKQLAEFSKTGSAPSSGAVPVTVWVQPQAAER